MGVGLNRDGKIGRGKRINRKLTAFTKGDDAGAFQ